MQLYDINKKKIVIFLNQYFKFGVFYTFGTRGFIFRKTAVYTVIVGTFHMHQYKQNKSNKTNRHKHKYKIKPVSSAPQTNIFT